VTRQLHLHPLLDLAVRLAVGVTFLIAAPHKIWDVEAFAQATYNYRILPDLFLHPVALYLPWLELVAGLAIVFNWQRRGAALLCAGMTLVFIGGISAALFRGLDISCGCFSADGHGVGLDLLLRDIVLLAGCLILLFSESLPWRRSGGSQA